MTPLIVQTLVRRIHTTSGRIVLVANGGISGLSALLGAVFPPRALLEVLVMHTPAAVNEFLGQRPPDVCSAATARALAMAAFLKSQQYAGEADQSLPEGLRPQLIGAACLVQPIDEGQPRRAEVHVAVQTADATLCSSIKLTDGARSFSEEDHVAGRLLMNELAAACGFAGDIPLGLMVSEHVNRQFTPARDDWQTLFMAEVPAILAQGQAPAETTAAHERVIFPGSFNPLHHGHREMAAVAQHLLGRQVEFEISIQNVDKPPLDYASIAARVEQFAADDVLWLTRAPRFTQKAQLFPGATFVVGIDTILRLASPGYYRGGKKACEAAIQTLVDKDCRFLVFGREHEGDFRALSQLELPPALLARCQEVPESDFRQDVSSTALRQA